MKLCEKHTNVRASADFCAICLLNERDELRAGADYSELLARLDSIANDRHVFPYLRDDARVAAKAIRSLTGAT